MMSVSGCVWISETEKEVDGGGCNINFNQQKVVPKRVRHSSTLAI